MRRERARTVQATELVHEAYLRLARDKPVKWQNRGHFVAIAAIAMRRLLVERARARGAAKRGGPQVQVTLDERLLAGGGHDETVDLVALDQALIRLAAVRRIARARRRAPLLRRPLGRGNRRIARHLTGHREASLDDGEGVASARARRARVT